MWGERPVKGSCSVLVRRSSKFDKNGQVGSISSNVEYLNGRFGVVTEKNKCVAFF